MESKGICVLVALINGTMTWVVPLVLFFLKKRRKGKSPPTKATGNEPGSSSVQKGEGSTTIEAEEHITADAHKSAGS